jgi:autotransporter translocation and assembly factor TamB
MSSCSVVVHGLRKSGIMISLVGATDWNSVECWNLRIKVKFVDRYVAIPQDVANVLIDGTVSVINTSVVCCKSYAKNVN